MSNSRSRKRKRGDASSSSPPLDLEEMVSSSQLPPAKRRKLSPSAPTSQSGSPRSEEAVEPVPTVFEMLDVSEPVDRNAGSEPDIDFDTDTDSTAGTATSTSSFPDPPSTASFTHTRSYQTPHPSARNRLQEEVRAEDTRLSDRYGDRLDEIPRGEIPDLSSSEEEENADADADLVAPSSSSSPSSELRRRRRSSRRLSRSFRRLSFGIVGTRSRRRSIIGRRPRSTRPRVNVESGATGVASAGNGDICTRRPMLVLAMVLAFLVLISLILAYVIGSLVRSGPVPSTATTLPTPTTPTTTTTDPYESASAMAARIDSILSDHSRRIEELNEFHNEWRRETAMIREIERQMEHIRSMVPHQTEPITPEDETVDAPLSDDDVAEMVRVKDQMLEALSQLRIQMEFVSSYEARIFELEQSASSPSTTTTQDDHQQQQHHDRLVNEIEDEFKLRLQKQQSKMAVIEAEFEASIASLDVKIQSVNERLASEVAKRADLVAVSKVSREEEFASIRDIVRSLILSDRSTLTTMEKIFRDQLQKAVVSVGDFSEDAILKVVRHQLAIFQSDRINRTDFALQSMGGHIVSTSPAYESYRTFLYRHLPSIRFRRWLMKNTMPPEVVIQANLNLGECFPLKGSSGHITIRLPHPVVPDAFSIDHIAKALTPNPGSAPKDFQVWGYHKMTEDPVYLGRYTYDFFDAVQTFELEAELVDQRSFYEFKLEILSNYGHEEFTCVYRFRIHGKRDEELMVAAP